MTAALSTRWRAPIPVLGAILGGWVFAVAGELWGAAHTLHHDTLIEGGLPKWAALALFLVAWQTMIAAMMLPSSLPMIALFARVAQAQPRPGLARTAFLAGYATIWTSFGALAFIGDMGVHRTVDSWPWLDQRPWLIGGPMLLLAGAFQFTPLKERCLRECRRPEAFLLGRYARGVEAAFRVGRAHGLFCLGCCWALMLLVFAAGVANLAWMAVLTLVMTLEKNARGGSRLVGVVGTALILTGALVLAHPPGLPALFAPR